MGRILAAGVGRLAEYRPELQALWQVLSGYRIAFDLRAAQAMMATVTLDDLWELPDRSLLQGQPVAGEVATLVEKWRFQFSPLVQRFAQQQAGDLTQAHQKASFYYLSHLSPKPWQQLVDLANPFEVFHHWSELKQYIHAFKIIQFCDNFLDLQGHNQIRLELYGQLVQAFASREHGKLSRMKQERNYCLRFST